VSALRKNGHLITTASERINRMVQSLKSFARLDQAPFQKFCLNDSVRDSLAVLEPVLPKELTVIQEYGKMPSIYGYPAELNQVVMNLIQNASEAVSGEGQVTVRTYADNGYQCLQITDTGRGIPPEQLERLFNPGFTVEGSRIKASMSLFTSLNIVQKHNGEIKVDSKVGSGSTFTVRVRGLDASEEFQGRST
jgi:signal transduction histidine kinase